jgi:hypothetical protein
MKINEYNPKPSENYDDLLRQFKTCVKLVATQDKMMAELSKDKMRLERELKLLDTSELQAERDTNQMLTRELEKLEAKLHGRKGG